MQHLRALRELIGREYLPRWGLLALTSVFVGLMELAGALLVFALISAMLNPGHEVSWPVIGDLRHLYGDPTQQRFLTFLGLTVAAFSLIRALVFLVQTYLQQRLAHNAAVRLSGRLFGAYLRMPYEVHLRRNSTVLLRNLNLSVMEIALHGFVPIVTIVSESLLGLGLATALVISSPIATGALLVGFSPILWILLRTSRKAFRRLGDRVHELDEVSLRYSQQSLQGIRDVKTLGREAFFQRLFSDTRIAIAKALYTRGVLIEVPRVATETLFMVGLGAMVAINVARNGSGTETLSSLGLMAYAGVRLMPSLNRIVAQVGNLQFATAAIINIHKELLEHEQPEVERESSVRLPFERAIQVSGVGFSYESSEKEILSGVDILIPKGSSLGIVGPTGAGKSTLLDLLMGLLTPTTGEITVDGISIHIDPRSWHVGIGVVPQAPFLLDDSIRRNIALGLTDDVIEDDKVALALSRAQLVDFVDDLPEGLDTKVGERGLRLSGGQRQRLAVARALYNEPDVLFLDEATSALDRVTERNLVAGLNQPDIGSTVIMVSHRVSSLSECDQIVLLANGRLIEAGSFNELNARSALFREMAS
jgi:ATP-binding cassette subfamily C protein